MKKVVLFLAAFAALNLTVSCDNENDKPKENPNPTTIGNIYIAKADLATDPDGFNMLTDGGFERFNNDDEWKQKSLWYLPDYVREAAEPLSGNRSLFADCNSRDFRDVFIQSVCVKKNSSYTLSLWYRGAWKGLNAYLGFRGTSTHDKNTNNPEANDSWAEYSYTLENVDDTKVDAFFGGFCWDNLWLEADDVKVIPTSTNNDSFIPQTVSSIANDVTNASYAVVSAPESAIVWVEENGMIAAVLHNATVGDAKIENVFVSSNDTDASDGIKILDVAENSIVSAESGSQGCIPTAGITVNGTRYVHYYDYMGMAEETTDNPNPDWIAAGSAMMSSTDGVVWTKVNGFSRAADSKFIKVAYCKKGDWIYVFGTAAGDKNVMTYVARVAPANFSDATKYEYWDGGEWVENDESAATGIIYGPTSEMSVVYNSTRYTYMMIYRSITTGCLVYRDAGLPEGEWSGEKILVADPEGSELFAPQILGATNDNIYFIASKR